MPRTKIVAVVTILRIACSFSEIIEIVRGILGVKFVIADRWSSAVLHAAPCLVVAVKIFPGSVWIGEITDGDHSSRNLIKQLGRPLRARDVGTIRDIARAYKDGCFRSLRWRTHIACC